MELTELFFQITGKVKDKIKLKEFNPGIESEPIFLESWYVNLFKIGRKDWFIFTEAKTLYSVVLPAKGINDPKYFKRQCTDVLFDLMRYRPEITQESFERLADKIIFCKTDNRRIMGSQNDLIKMAEAIFHYNGTEDFDKINQTPMSYLGRDSPDAAFLRELEKLG